MTDRGVRLLPGLTGGQALGLLATGGLSWLAWHGRWPVPVRDICAVLLAAVGATYTLGRWPSGAEGERAAVWLPRLIRRVLAPRTRAGAAVPGWDGLEACAGDLLRHRGGWAAVLEIGGADFLLRGPHAAQAAQAAFRELLHATGSPLQIVGCSRGLSDAERPAGWDGQGAPAPLADLARAYARHWDGLVADGGAVWRRCFIVLCEPAGTGAPSPCLPAVEAAVVQFGERVGLAVRRIRGSELIALLRESGGAADVAAGWDEGGRWRVSEARG